MKPALNPRAAFRVAVLGGGLGLLSACAGSPPQPGRCQSLHSGNFILFNYANISNDEDCGRRDAVNNVYSAAVKHGQPVTAAGALRALATQDPALAKELDHSIDDSLEKLRHPSAVGCDLIPVPGRSDQVKLGNCVVVSVSAPKPAGP